jgi:hypothetical protein
MANIKLRYPVTEKYLIARRSSLVTPAKRFEKFIKGDEVYGVVIDMPVAPRIAATLVAYINGAANIHFNHGEEYVGAATRYLSVVKAASLLVMQAEKIRDNTELVKSFDMPSGTDYNVYLLTKEGIRKLVYRPAEIKPDDENMKLFHFASQNLMKELHEAQLKDRAAKEK